MSPSTWQHPCYGRWMVGHMGGIWWESGWLRNFGRVLIKQLISAFIDFGGDWVRPPTRGCFRLPIDWNVITTCHIQATTMFNHKCKSKYVTWLWFVTKNFWIYCGLIGLYRINSLLWDSFCRDLTLFYVGLCLLDTTILFYLKHTTTHLKTSTSRFLFRGPLMHYNVQWQIRCI